MFIETLKIALREIIYTEIVFVIGLFIIFLLFRNMMNSDFDFVPTKSVELIMTIITFVMLFGIPYLVFTYSFSITLLIVFGLSVLLSTLACLLGYPKNKTA